MSESVTVLAGPEASSPLGLGGPVPQPIAATDPISLIGDVDPAAAAKQLLESACPDAPSLLAARIEAIGRQVDDLVEQYRLNPKLPFGDFLGFVVNRVKLRRTLEARAGVPTAGSAASEVLGIVTSVRRWRPAEEFRRERSRRIEAIIGELDLVEGSIRHTVESARAGSGFATSDASASAAGLAHDHDEILRRLTKALESRKALRDRLARLDAHGDGGRSQAVQSAIEATGGVDALVGTLAPSMTAAASDALAKVRRDINGIGGQLESIDDESRLYAELSERLEGLRSQVPALQSAIRSQKTDAAGALVSAAIGGTLPAVQALEAAVGDVRPGLASALNTIRADADALLATVAELIG
jgi:hypothetical protein